MPVDPEQVTPVRDMQKLPRLDFGFFIRRLLEMRERFRWDDSVVARFAALEFHSYVEDISKVITAGDRVNRESLALVTEWHAQAKRAQDELQQLRDGSEAQYWHDQHDGARRNALRISAERDDALKEVQKLRATNFKLWDALGLCTVQRTHLDAENRKLLKGIGGDDIDP